MGGASKVIAVSGIKRSGSTWQYNAARLLCPDAEVVKEHCYDASLAERATHILLTDRDDEGILASWRAFRPLEPPNLNRWRGWLRRYQSHHHHLTPYHQIGTLTAIEDIASYLGSARSPSKVFKQLSEIALPDSDQDPITLYFPNHRRLK